MSSGAPAGRPPREDWRTAANPPSSVEQEHQEKGCPEALPGGCRAGRGPGAVPQRQTDPMEHPDGVRAAQSRPDGPLILPGETTARPVWGLPKVDGTSLRCSGQSRRVGCRTVWRDPVHGRYSRSDYSARLRAPRLRRRHQTPKPTGAAIAASTSEEGSGTPLIKRESIAKSPETAGGSLIPKTIEVISAFVSRTPMRTAEPPSSAVESPSSVNVPRLVVPEKAVMVAVKGPAWSS